MDPDEPTVGEHLLRRFGPVSGAEGPLPDEVWIAALIEDRLSPAEREAVEEALLRSPEARSLAAEMAALTEEMAEEEAEETQAEDESEEAECPTPVARHPRTPSRPWKPLMLAASVLLALGAGLWASGVLGGRSEPSADVRLADAARALAHTAPDVFGEFRALDAKERAAPAATNTRGGITPIQPAARSLTSTPTFRWLPIPGATRYKVVVLDDTGSTVYAAETKLPHLEYRASQANPPLLPGGTYVWEVSTDEGPLGPVAGRRSFTVTTQAEAAHFEAARRAVAEHAAADLREILLAHAAIRWDLLAEAERLLRARLGAHPEDRVARETLSYVLRRLGDDEAAAAAQRDN